MVAYFENEIQSIKFDCLISKNESNPINQSIKSEPTPDVPSINPAELLSGLKKTARSERKVNAPEETNNSMFVGCFIYLFVVYTR